MKNDIRFSYFLGLKQSAIFYDLLMTEYVDGLVDGCHNVVFPRYTHHLFRNQTKSIDIKCEFFQLASVLLAVW